MKRFWALLTACLLAASSALAATDYTVAEKLVKQLAAGSGFSGVITLEADTETFSTQQPIVLDVDYIYVRPETVSLGEHRIDLELMDGETPAASAHVQVLDGELALHSDLIGPDWYALSAPETSDAAQSGAVGSLAGAIAALAATQGLDAEVDSVLEEALEAFTTRIDIWIEGYRQNADISKLEDGTSVMHIRYAVSASALKAQIKQMVFELLGDAATVSALQQVLGEELAVYVDPRYRSWYFDCIEALPLSGELTIDRTVTLMGETLELKLSLPMYSPEFGEMTLVYERTHSGGDLPDDHVIRLTSQTQLAELNYQEYSSMTGVKVMQGTLCMQPAEGFGVSDESLITCDVQFSLRQEQTEGKDENGLDRHTFSAALTLAPTTGDAFPETEIVLQSAFVSEERKSAATDMSAQLTISNADEAVEISMTGKSRKKWEPAALPAAPVQNPDWASLLPGAGVRALAVLSSFITLPTAE